MFDKVATVHSQTAVKRHDLSFVRQRIYPGKLTGGKPDYCYFPGDARKKETPYSNRRVYCLLEDDLEKLAAAPHDTVVVQTENGTPTAAFAQADAEHRNPIYFRVIRDAQKFTDGKFEILDSGRNRVRGADISGVKVVEGIETYAIVQKGKQAEVCCLQSRVFYFGSHPLKYEFKPSHVSMVVVDGETSLFSVPEPRFDEISARIANLVVKIHDAGKYERKVRTIAQRAHSAYKTGKQREFNKRIKKLLRLLGQPVKKSDQHPLYSIDYRGFLSFKLCAGRKKDGEYSYVIFSVGGHVYSVHKKDIKTLEISPQNGIVVQMENGYPTAFFSPTDADHQNPVYLRVVRDCEKWDGENWELVRSTRNVKKEDISGIKIVEGIKTLFFKEKAGDKEIVREKFILGPRTPTFKTHKADSISVSNNISVVSANGSEILFAAPGPRFSSDTKEIIDVVVSIYKAGRFKRSVRAFARTAYQDLKDGNKEEYERKLEILKKYSAGGVQDPAPIESETPADAEEEPKPQTPPKPIESEVSAETEKVPQHEEPLKPPKPPKQQKPPRPPKPQKHEIPLIEGYTESVKRAEKLSRRISEGWVSPARIQQTEESIAAYLQLPDDKRWELLKTAEGRALAVRAAKIRKQMK